MAEGLEDDRLRTPPFDAISPVPLACDAAAANASSTRPPSSPNSLASRTGKPLLPCLRRTRYTTTQTRLDRQERMENLRGAFSVRHASEVIDRHLLLIDDIFTTGSTVEECSRVLRNAGAASVRVLTVARA